MEPCTSTTLQLYSTFAHFYKNKRKNRRSPQAKEIRAAVCAGFFKMKCKTAQYEPFTPFTPSNLRQFRQFVRKLDLGVDAQSPGKSPGM